MPPQIAPYHLRLDWMMWFAGFSSYDENPWFVHLVEKLLQGDAQTLSLLRSNPFPGNPPHYIRAELYEYRFATPEEHKATGRWWDRQFSSGYFPVVAMDTPGFRQVLAAQGWL